MYRIEPLNILNYKQLKYLEYRNMVDSGSQSYYYDDSYTDISKMSVYKDLSPREFSKYTNYKLVFVDDRAVALVQINTGMFNSICLELQDRKSNVVKMLKSLLKSMPNYVLQVYDVSGRYAKYFKPVNLVSSINSEKSYKSNLGYTYYVVDDENKNLVRDGLERYYTQKLDVNKIRFRKQDAAVDIEQHGEQDFVYWETDYSTPTLIGFRYHTTNIRTNSAYIFEMYVNDLLIGVIKCQEHENYMGVAYVDISQFYKSNVVDLENLLISQWKKQLQKDKVAKMILLPADNEEEKARHLTERMKKLLSGFDVMSYEEGLYRRYH